MSLLNKIPEYIIDENNNVVTRPEEVYIDDIFDPLFNAKARSYLDAKYNWGPIGNTIAGFTEGIDNALIGQNDKWGILGPGMGILSGFGRSMDKAGDFIIGGITEGVNAFGHVLGSKVPVENPISNIFVEDQDYTGNRLMAAMANSMSHLAGDVTIDESDFQGLPYNAAGLGLELVTDPGIFGGALTAMNAPDIYNIYKSTGKYSSKQILKNLGQSGVKSAVGEVGQLLSNYDDLMAKVAIDGTAPGLRPLLKNTVDSIFRVFEAQRLKGYQDTSYSKKVTPKTVDDLNVDNMPKELDKNSPYYGAQWMGEDINDFETLYQMTDDVLSIMDIDPVKDPELYAKLMQIKDHESFSKLTYGEIQELANREIDRHSKMTEFRNNLEQSNKEVHDDINAIFKDKEGKYTDVHKDLLMVDPNTSNELPNQFEHLLLHDKDLSNTLQESISDWDGQNVYDVLVSEGFKPNYDFDPRGLKDKIISFDTFSEINPDGTRNIDFKALADALDNTNVDIDDPLYDTFHHVRNLIRRKVGDGYSKYTTPFIFGVSHSNRRAKLVEPAVRSFVSEFEDILTRWMRTGQLDFYLKEYKDGNTENMGNALARAIGISDADLREALHYGLSKEDLLDKMLPEQKPKTLSLGDPSHLVFDEEVHKYVDELPEVKEKMKELKDAEDMAKYSSDKGFKRLFEREYSFDELKIPLTKDDLALLETFGYEKTTIPNLRELLDDIIGDYDEILRKSSNPKDIAVNEHAKARFEKYQALLNQRALAIKQFYDNRAEEFSSKAETLRKELDNLKSKHVRERFKELRVQGAEASINAWLHDHARRARRARGEDVKGKVSPPANPFLENFEYLPLKKDPKPITKIQKSYSETTKFKPRLARKSKFLALPIYSDAALDDLFNKKYYNPVLDASLKHPSYTSLRLHGNYEDIQAKIFKDNPNLLKNMLSESEFNQLVQEELLKLSKQELEALKAKGYNYENMNPMIRRSIELGDEGTRFIPGLDILLDLNSPYLEGSNKLELIYSAISDFVGFTQNLKHTYPRTLNNPNVKRLVDLGEKWLMEVEYPLKGIKATQGPSGFLNKELSEFPTDSLNALTSRSPTFWYNKDGSFNVKKFRKFRTSFNNLTVFPNSFYKDRIVKITPEQFGYSMDEVKEILNKVSTNPDIELTQEEFARLFAKNSAVSRYLRLHNPNLKEVISYIFHPKVDLDTRKLRLQELARGEISVGNLPNLIKGQYKFSDIEIDSELGKVLLGEREEFIQGVADTGKNPHVPANREIYTSRFYTDESGKRVKNLNYNRSQDAIEFFNTTGDKYYTNLVVNPKSVGEYKFIDAERQLFPEFDFNDAPIKENIQKYGTVKDITLYDILEKSSAIKSRNEIKDYASLRTDRVTNLIDTGRKYNTSNGKVKIRKFFDNEYIRNGDVVEGKDFLPSIIQSKGFALFKAQAGSEQYTRVRKALEQNITALGATDILRITETTLKDGDTVLCVSLNNANKKLYKKYTSLLNAKTALADTVYAKASSVVDTEDFSELSQYFKDFDEFNNAMHTEFGRTSFNKMASRRVLLETDENLRFMNNLYKDLDINPSELELNASAIRAFMENKGAYGTLDALSPFKGEFSRWAVNGESLLDTDLEHIVKNNFSTGIYDNINTQTHIDVFVNDNFNIHGYMNGVEDLKRTFFAKDSNGKLTGNMYNLTLCSPIRNQAGKITGFKKYNKFSDLDLQKAWDHPETVLLPVDTIAHLDNLCKKDRKMSNAFYRFVNKYLTLPFKFGIIANPGFLVSNVSDAYFKQAVNMANAYGTSIPEELTNVARSLRSVVTLNNQFTDIFQKYAVYLQEVNPKVNPVYLNAKSVAGMPKAKQMFIDYLNSPKCTLTPSELGVVRTFMELNSIQSMDMFQDTLADTLVSDSLSNAFKYEDPKNLGERILTGGSKYNPKDISTWGLFYNNPYINMIMKSNSEIETMFRQAAILNDMSHKGYSLDRMAEILGLDLDIERQVTQKFKIDLIDAQNAMNASNFHYEATTGLTDFASTIIPFPTFFLKNFAFWMQIMNENPQMIDHLITVQENMWRGREKEVEKDQFKAEAKGRGAVPVGSGQNLSTFFKGIYKPSPLNSMFSAFHLLNNPVEDIQYRLHPTIKLTTSPFMKDEDVKYRPYSTNQYEKNVDKGDPNFNPINYALHSVNPYERTVNTYLRTPGKIAKGNAQLSDVLPSIFQPDFSKTSTNKKKRRQ